MLKINTIENNDVKEILKKYCSQEKEFSKREKRFCKKIKNILLILEFIIIIWLGWAYILNFLEMVGNCLVIGFSVIFLLVASLSISVLSFLFKLF